MSVTALAAFGAVGPEDSTSAGQVDIAPVEIQSFGHARTGADEEGQQWPQMRRGGVDQLLDLFRKKKAGAALVLTRHDEVWHVAPAELLRIIEDRPHRHDDRARVSAWCRVRSQHLALQLERLFLIGRGERDVA